MSEFDKDGDFTKYSGETIDNRTSVFDSALLEGTSPGFQAPLINTLRGISVLGRGPAMMPLSDDTEGFQFVTRPKLNLTDDNISRSESLQSLMDCGPNSIGGFIRGTLDERWAAANNPPTVVNRNPFIPCLTNYLKSTPGFNDLQFNIKTSDPGIREQVYQSIDSKLEENGSYTLSTTYYNPAPSIIPSLFRYWLSYISEVSCGDRQVAPRDKYLFGNRCDHDCRIYNLVLNKDGMYLENIFASCQSIPSTYAIGALSAIDYSNGIARAEGQDEFTMNYASVGMRFNEFGLINAFNDHSYLYNPSIRPETRNQYYREIEPDEMIEYGYAALPLLLPKTSERVGKGAFAGARSGIKLTWWVDR